MAPKGTGYPLLHCLVTIEMFMGIFRPQHTHPVSERIYSKAQITTHVLTDELLATESFTHVYLSMYIGSWLSNMWNYYLCKIVSLTICLCTVPHLQQYSIYNMLKLLIFFIYLTSNTNNQLDKIMIYFMDDETLPCHILTFFLQKWRTKIEDITYQGTPCHPMK